MLIRSQEKKTIFDMSGCTLGINLENEVYGFGNNSLNEDPPTILGYYSTEERAIAVLDEICNYYESNENGVFQMPEA